MVDLYKRSPSCPSALGFLHPRAPAARTFTAWKRSSSDFKAEDAVQDLGREHQELVAVAAHGDLTKGSTRVSQKGSGVSPASKACSLGEQQQSVALPILSKLRVHSLHRGWHCTQVGFPRLTHLYPSE